MHLRYLYQQLQYAYGGQQSIFIHKEDSHICSLKSGVSFHLFTSHTPCEYVTVFHHFKVHLWIQSVLQKQSQILLYIIEFTVFHNIHTTMNHVCSNQILRKKRKALTGQNISISNESRFFTSSENIPQGPSGRETKMESENTSCIPTNVPEYFKLCPQLKQNDSTSSPCNPYQRFCIGQGFV